MEYFVLISHVIFTKIIILEKWNSIEAALNKT
jgi:hypothetical protein